MAVLLALVGSIALARLQGDSSNGLADDHLQPTPVLAACRSFASMDGGFIRDLPDHLGVIRAAGRATEGDARRTMNAYARSAERYYVPSDFYLPRGLYVITDREDVSAAHSEPRTAMIDLCRGAGSPDVNPSIVPASLGPEPQVDLASYGEVQPLRPTDLVVQFIIGPILSPVRGAVSDAGARLIVYEYDGPNGRQQVVDWGLGLGGGWAADFGADDGLVMMGGRFRGGPPDGRPPIPFVSPDVVRLRTSADTSFVVLELPDGRRFVQRPAERCVVLAWPADRETPDAQLVARTYDADGNQIDCRAAIARHAERARDASTERPLVAQSRHLGLRQPQHVAQHGFGARAQRLGR